jgi:hypothetical protein
MMDQRQLSQDGGQTGGSEDQQPSDAMPVDSSVPIQTSNEQDDVPEDALLADEAAGWSAQFVLPFQQSGPLPAMNPQTSQTSTNQAGTPAQGRATSRRFPILKVALISTLIVLAMGFFVFSVFAQPASHLTTAAKNPTHRPLATQTTPMAKSTRTVQRTPTPTIGTATPQATSQNTWVPSAHTLQELGWTRAGLSTGDALEAERTAWTFIDREMSLDYRNVGSQAQHSGTLTASVFLLTPNARTRFFQNDVRVINNVLFDRVQQQQLIQEVVNAQPHLVHFQVQGQQQFAWVDVTFQLWQSRLDPQTGSRADGLELDPTTHEPRINHMIVLLLRVNPGAQGVNAPMGGTGWLVSTYALDLAGGSLPGIIQPA